MKYVLSAMVCLGCLFMVADAGAQKKDPAKNRLEKSPRHHEWVTVKTSTGRKVKVFVVFPEVKKGAMAVIVIHENKGLTDWVRGVADQLAEAGFVALAPDLLSQTGPGGGDTEAFKSSDAARKGIYKLKEPQVMSDLDAVFKYAKDMKAVHGKVAVAGFCWGGGQCFSYAAHNPNIAAAFVFYGRAPKSMAEYKKIKAPVYGFYGGNDFRISGQVARVAKKMKSLDKTYKAMTYDGAGHGFMRAGEAADASKANRMARNHAWQRWKKLLKKISE